jgi:hypothetical protein
MGGFIAVVTLLNTAAPGLIKLVGILTQKADGTWDAVAILDQAEAQNAANIKQLADWFSAHPKG